MKRIFRCYQCDARLVPGFDDMEQRRCSGCKRAWGVK